MRAVLMLLFGLTSFVAGAQSPLTESIARLQARYPGGIYLSYSSLNDFHHLLEDPQKRDGLMAQSPPVPAGVNLLRAYLNSISRGWTEMARAIAFIHIDFMNQRAIAKSMDDFKGSGDRIDWTGEEVVDVAVLTDSLLQHSDLAAKAAKAALLSNQTIAKIWSEAKSLNDDPYVTRRSLGKYMVVLDEKIVNTKPAELWDELSNLKAQDGQAFSQVVSYKASVENLQALLEKGEKAWAFTPKPSYFDETTAAARTDAYFAALQMKSLGTDELKGAIAKAWGWQDVPKDAYIYNAPPARW